MLNFLKKFAARREAKQRLAALEAAIAAHEAAEQALENAMYADFEVPTCGAAHEDRWRCRRCQKRAISYFKEVAAR